MGCEGAIGGTVRWGGGPVQRQRCGSQKEAMGLAEHYTRRERTALRATKDIQGWALTKA